MITDSTPNPKHSTTVTSFSSKMSFNFPFACRQRGGLCLASPFFHSFLKSLDYKFMQRSCICSTAAWVNALWQVMRMCGRMCHSFDSLSTSDGGEPLLFPLPTCQLRPLTASGAWKHTLFLFCSYRKNPNSQEMKHTKASASAPLMCPP